MMFEFRNVFSCFLVSGLIFATGCSDSKSPKETKEQPRLVILYSTCSVNKDYLSPYNVSVSYTPNLEMFAKKSVVFNKHITEAGQSGTTYASIFSGTQAYRHGVYRHPTELPNDLYLISEAYNDNGYETFFWNRHAMASARLNYGQGIEGKNVFAGSLLRGDSPEFLEILQKLKTDKHYRAFVMVTFTVTHSPYIRSERDNRRDLELFLKSYPAEAKSVGMEDIQRYGRLYQKNRHELQWSFPETVKKLNLLPKDIAELSEALELEYKKNVYRLDKLFGEVVKEVEKAGLLDESLIVFTADHGEILYRENSFFKWTHGAQLAPEVLNVPLIIYSSKPKARPIYYDKITRSIDVFPTMIGLSGLSLPPQAGIEGVDLSRAMLGLEAAPDLLGYSHTCVLCQLVIDQVKDWPLLYKMKPRVDVNLIWASIRKKDTVYKLRTLDATNWGTEVFDLENDPMETVNLYDSKLRKHEEMDKKLRAYKERLVRAYNNREHAKSDESAHPVSLKEQIDALKSLGYIK